VKTWNDNVNSRAKGAATGKTFEKWITDFLVRNGKKVEKGNVDFKFGAFQVDVAIPSRKAPQVLFEIKINSDRQHARAPYRNPLEGFLRPKEGVPSEKICHTA
jgi:hypothetical protein